MRQFSPDLLRTTRTNAGLSQYAVAKSAGIHLATYRDIESGRYGNTAVNKVTAIAAALGVTVEALCEEVDEPKSGDAAE
jgi:transcriptional regulator with XRE-family HTH domain